MQYFFADAPIKKKFKNFVYEGVQHFLGTKYKIFFALIKKIFLQPLVEIIFRYHKICLGFCSETP